MLAAVCGQENRNQRSLLFEAVKNPNSSSVLVCRIVMNSKSNVKELAFTEAFGHACGERGIRKGRVEEVFLRRCQHLVS